MDFQTVFIKSVSMVSNPKRMPFTAAISAVFRRFSRNSALVSAVLSS